MKRSHYAVHTPSKNEIDVSIKNLKAINQMVLIRSPQKLLNLVVMNYKNAFIFIVSPDLGTRSCT